MTGQAAGAKTAQRGMLKWGLFEDSIGPTVFLLSNALTSRSLAALAPFRLPAGSLSVLTLIHANPNCSQMDLSRTTGMSKSGVVGIIDELERRGLASRGRSQDDRRRYRLTLTKEGEAQLHEMVAVQLAQEEAIRQELSREELRQLAGMLRRAYRSVTKKPTG